MKKLLIATNSPHVRSSVTTQKIMLDVIIALLPALIAANILFGLRALLVTLTCVVSCVLFEYIFGLLVKKENIVSDLSAVVTGVLLAFNLPVSIPIWMAMFGSFTAMIVVKQLFGGIGQNFVNPALAARVIMQVSFPSAMVDWRSYGVVTSSSATPLTLIAKGDVVSLAKVPDLIDLFLGIHGGCLGETCALALLIGGIYLMIRRVIGCIIPLSYIGTVFVLTWIMGYDPLVQITAGGLIIGAFFMATDYTTSPFNKIGKIIFGIGCGILTVVIRVFAGTPEGVSYAILFMNLLVPYIDKIRVAPFGTEQRIKNA